MKKIDFQGAPHPKETSKGNYYLIYRDRDLALNKGGSPLFVDPPAKDVSLTVPLYIGTLNDKSCWAVEVKNDSKDLLPGINDPEFTPLRPQFASQEEGLILALSRGRHLINWSKTAKFCPNCGDKTAPHPQDTAKRCPSCEHVSYPPISPAVITAVFQGDKILLAHNKNFPEDMYSLIAGFVDPGETLEQTVAREIKEEVGLKVTDIRYVSSQSWPFPSSLMLGFTARCPEGEPVPDGVEILKAGWFDKSNLPDIPAPGSISRTIIDRYLTEAPF